MNLFDTAQAKQTISGIINEILCVGMFAVYLAPAVTIGYVVFHFVGKYW